MQPRATYRGAPQPCPFCGGEGEQLTMQKTLRDGYRDHQDDADAFAYRMVCQACATEGPWYKTEGNAHRGWNTRITQFARITYLVVHVEGGNIQGVYTWAGEQQAIDMADGLWSQSDPETDDVRVFRFKEGISHQEQYLDQVYMPDEGEAHGIG